MLNPVSEDLDLIATLREELILLRKDYKSLEKDYLQLRIQKDWVVLQLQKYIDALMSLGGLKRVRAIHYLSGNDASPYGESEQISIGTDVLPE